MRSLLVVLMAVTVVACGDTYITVPTAPTAVTPPTVPVTPVTIEFRALGTPTSVRVRTSAPADGLAQVVTTLPYFASFKTTSDTLFLSLEGTPLIHGLLATSPFFAIQILVNGNLFRESTSTNLFPETLLVSGTWRR